MILITPNTMNQIQLDNHNIYSNNKTNLVIKIFDKTCYMFEENQFDICMQRYVETTRGKKQYTHMVKIINMIVSLFWNESLVVPSVLMYFPTGSGKTLENILMATVLVGVKMVFIPLITLASQQDPIDWSNVNITFVTV